MKYLMELRTFVFSFRESVMLVLRKFMVCCQTAKKVKELQYEKALRRLDGHFDIV